MGKYINDSQMLGALGERSIRGTASNLGLL